MHRAGLGAFTHDLSWLYSHIQDLVVLGTRSCSSKSIWGRAQLLHSQRLSSVRK